MQFGESLLLAQDMMSVGIIGLMFILVVVFAVLGAKHWHWVNIVLLVFCFITGTSAIWGMTQAFGKRRKAQQDLETAQTRYDKAMEQYEQVVKGDPDDITYSAGSLRATSDELSRELEGRGRVWPNGQVAKNNQLRTFTFAMSREEDLDDAPLKDVVLFAFLENNVGGQLYPARYIGSVRVTAETSDELQLEAVALADPRQFNNPTGSWALFEKMPLDRRDLFKKAIATLIGLSEDVPAEQKEFASKLEDPNAELDISMYRKILMAEPFLPAARLGFNPNSREYEELIDRYAFDGLSLGKINNWIEANSANRKSLRFEPPPEEIFIVYRFDEKSSKAYQVDANGNVETDGLFTPLGAAVDVGLHAGGDVEFGPGDTVMVDKRTADGYQRNDQQIAAFKQGEAVTQVDQIYIRQLRDYPYEFSNLRNETDKLISETERMRKANAVQQKAIDDAQKQIAERSKIGGELEQDGQSLAKDLEVIKALAARRAAELEQDKKTIRELEKRIQATYLEIRQIAVDISKRAFSKP